MTSPIGKTAVEGANARAARSAAYRAERDRTRSWVAIAKLVIQRRMVLGMTQQELATRAKTSYSAISRLEGGRHATHLETLHRIFAGLGADLLVGYEVRADDESDVEGLPDIAPGEHDAPALARDQRRRRKPPHARPAACVEQRGVQPIHAPNAELIAIGDEMQTPQRRRVEKHIANRRAELLRRQREVFPSLAHENAGGADGGGQRLLAIDQEDARAAFGEESRGVESRKAGTDDGDIVTHEVLYSTK